MILHGRFFAGQSSQVVECTCAVDDLGNLQFKHLPGQVYRLADATISPALGNHPRQISFADGSMFQTRDLAALAQLEKQHRLQSGVMHLVDGIERYWRWVLLSVLILVISTVLFFKYVLPAVSAQIAHQLPVSIDRQLGAQMQGSLDEWPLGPSEIPADEQARLNALFAPYLQNDAGFEYTILFRKFALGPNAFALPGGSIIFCDDLIKLAENDAQLIAVLQHEMGHVQARHSLRGIIQSSFVYWVMLIFSGDISMVSESVAALPYMLMNLSYSRAMETEADDIAIQHLQHSGIAVQNLADILQRLENADELLAKNPPDNTASHTEEDNAHHTASRWLDYISTHPATAERIARIKAQAQHP